MGGYQDCSLATKKYIILSSFENKITFLSHINTNSCPIKYNSNMFCNKNTNTFINCYICVLYIDSQKCIQKLSDEEVERAFTNCVFDTCSLGDMTDQYMCSAAETLMSWCSAKKEVSLLWRSADFCRKLLACYYLSNIK